MDGVQEGVNTEQSAAASGVVENTAATESVSQEVAPDTSVQTDTAQQDSSQVAQGTEQVLTDGTEADKPVPYERFKEVNDAKNELTGRVTQLEQFIQVNAPNQQVQPQQPEQQSVTLQVMEEMGYDPENILTGKEQARVNDEVARRTTVVMQSQFQTQSFIASKPDFAKVVGVADPVTEQFKLAPPLQRVIENNPSIAQALRNAGAGANELAYAIASKDSQYLAEVAEASKDITQQASEQAAQVIQQANSMTSVSAVAGQGTLDRGAALRAMSDPEFEVYKQEIINKAGVVM